jgi:hypothetical protein
MISTGYNQIPGYMDSKRKLYPELLSPLRLNEIVTDQSKRVSKPDRNWQFAVAGDLPQEG